MGEKIKEKEAKEEVITAIYKLNLHCPQCACTIEKPVIRTSGTCTIVGTVEEKKLVEYIWKKVGKQGEIVPQKKEEEKKEVVKESKEVKTEKKEEVKVEEVKAKDVVVPYFIHCTHAPDWFSDENPNAYCSLM